MLSAAVQESGYGTKRTSAFSLTMSAPEGRTDMPLARGPEFDPCETCAVQNFRSAN